MGISCVLFQARYWLISSETASLLSSNCLPGDLHLWGVEAAWGNLWASGIHTLTVPGPVAGGRHHGGAHVMSPCLRQTDQSGGRSLGNEPMALEDNQTPLEII